MSRHTRLYQYIFSRRFQCSSMWRGVSLCKRFLRNVLNDLHIKVTSQPKTSPLPQITSILKPQISYFYPPFSSHHCHCQKHLQRWRRFIFWRRFLFLYGSTFSILFWNVTDGLISMPKSCWYFVPIYRVLLPSNLFWFEFGLDFWVAIWRTRIILLFL